MWLFHFVHWKHMNKKKQQIESTKINDRDDQSYALESSNHHELSLP